MTRACWRCGCTENCACPGGCAWVAPRLCSACEVTIETVATWTVRHMIHLDGPRGRRGWFGDIHVANQDPRLRRLTRCYRETRSVQMTWMVDGREVQGGLYCACQYLNAPPQLTVDEFSALARSPMAFADMRRHPDLPTLVTLRDKGLIEFRAGKCRRRSFPALSPHGDLIR